MRILNEKDEEITAEQTDLSNGYLIPAIILRDGAIPPDDVEKFAYTDEDFEEIQRYIAIPSAERNAQRIAELKSKLSATDYCIIKIAEGAATAEEYASIIADREGWRAEINELESEAASDE